MTFNQTERGTARPSEGPAELTSGPDGAIPLMPAEEDLVELGYDVSQITPVPGALRTSTQMDQFWIWAGANVAPINWVLGALGIQFGLSLIDTVAVIIVGNLIGAALFGFMCIMGHRTGVPQMVLSRATFGRRGAYLPTLMQVLMPIGWVAINTWVVLDLAMAAFERLGVAGSPELKYSIAVVVMITQVCIAAWGFNAIKYFERYTMPVILIIMLVMTGLAFFEVDVQWTVSTVSGINRLSAMSSLMTAIGIGWAIAWLVYASDYTRFTQKSLTDRQVFKATFLGLVIPSVWLACLGAMIASAGAGADPAQLIITVFGAMALPVLLVLVHGPIATNIVVIYSAALSVAALDLKVKRWVVSLLTGVVAMAVLVGFLQSGSFAASFQNLMILFVVWISPWGAITLLDYFWIKRKLIEVDQLYRAPGESLYGDINWWALASLLMGVFAGWTFQVGATPALNGPFAEAMGGIDLSWLVGAVVAAGLYLIRPGLRHA
ncbi:cytosine permease [Pseudotabrizicola sp. 4114]|uniref:purine-cytosine permease family protein n=1 Tax=Pseudotabrizicola sp. 4114 TaxID=2817731 RepID=UPI002860370E|nr:NCS1 nucleoside transporter family [Pseudorhodobacter sp. 4114]